MNNERVNCYIPVRLAIGASGDLYGSAGLRAGCQNMRSVIRCGVIFTVPSQFASLISFIASFRVA